MKNAFITLSTGLICLALGQECTWPQRILILIVAAGGMWAFAEWLSEKRERPAEKEPARTEKQEDLPTEEEPEELRRRNYFAGMLMAATLPEKRHTLEIGMLAGERVA